MRRYKPPYPPQFRAMIVELHRAGRTLSSLTKEFGVTDMTIRAWAKQADLDTGRRGDGLTSAEKQELSKLRRENARLLEERDILKKAAAWFAQEEQAARTPKKRSDS
jgi:transposase-like protein